MKNVAKAALQHLTLSVHTDDPGLRGATRSSPMTASRRHAKARRLIGAGSVFISVTLERQAEDALRVFEERVVELPEVMSAFRMTGAATIYYALSCATWSIIEHAWQNSIC